MIIMFIGVVAIFLNSIYITSQGQEYSLLLVVLNYITTGWDTAVFGSIIMLIVVIVAIVLITKSGNKEKNKEDE